MSDMTVYSGMNGSGGGDKLRILGMASGLDVDATVKKMMLGEQKKIDKVKQEKEVTEWKKEIYQEIIADIKTLQNKYFNIVNKENYLMSKDSFSSCDAKIIGNSTALSVSGGVGAKVGTYKVSYNLNDPDVSKRGQLASEAIKVGQSLEKIFNVTDLSGKSVSLSVNGGNAQTINVSQNVNVQDIVNDINNKINANADLKGKVQATEKNGTIQFETLTDDSIKVEDRVINPKENTTMQELGLTAEQNLEFIYNGKTTNVKVEKTDTINQVINKIGDATGQKVTASYSELTKQFSIKTADTGSNQSLKVTSGIDALGLKQDGTDITGKNTVVYITSPGGTAVKISKSTRAFDIDGISYNLKAEEDTSFSITKDEQKVYNKLKLFIDDFNKIVEKINTRLTEKKDYAYKPLTDEQRSKMKDSEIESWNKKAKQGILKNDERLENLLGELKKAFYTPVTGIALNIGKFGTNAIGIDSFSSYKERGKIAIVDPDKLKKAIVEHSDQIANLFCNTSSNSDKKINYQESGIITRMQDVLRENVGAPGTIFNDAILTKYANKQDDFSINGTAGENTLSDQIYRKDQKLKEMLKQFATKREQYYRKFSKLEVAMNQLNAQQSWLTQQLS